jgi:two-component system response regulator RegA
MMRIVGGTERAPAAFLPAMTSSGYHPAQHPSTKLPPSGRPSPQRRATDRLGTLRSEHLQVVGPQPCGQAASKVLPQPVPEPLGSVLLVDDEASTRAGLRCVLTRRGFAVTSVRSTPAALAAAAEDPFAHAVVELRLGRDSGLELITQLRASQPSMRIVVVTGFDSFASVVLALKAGAVDYFAKPVDGWALVEALLGHAPLLPPVPETPLGLKRVYWEYIQRIFEQSGRNVSTAARQLNMHRRTLQRILAKRAPCPRQMQLE